MTIQVGDHVEKDWFNEDSQKAVNAANRDFHELSDPSDIDACEVMYAEEFDAAQLAQIDVERKARDVWFGARELCAMRTSGLTRDFFSPQVECELWAAKTAIDTLISELRATDQRAA